MGGRANQYFQRIYQSVTRQGLMRQMGYRLGRVDKGYCEVILPYSDRITNQAQGFHGGAIGTIGDIAAGYAGLTVAAPGMEVTTVEYKINCLSAHKGGSLVAVGKVAKAGKKLIVTTAEIYHIGEPYDPMGHFFGSHDDTRNSDDEAQDDISLPKGQLCAILQQTLFPIPKTY
jgi:uncharacterized protein (TIGR00369 family)